MNRYLHALLVLFAASTLACGPDIDHCAEQDPGYVCHVAGTTEYGFNRDGNLPEDSDMYLVSQARRGPDGRLYMMDFNNQRIRVIDEAGLLQTIAGNGFHGPGYPGAVATESPLENPIDFDFLPDGRLVFVSYHDPRIIVLTDEGTLLTIAGTGDIGEIGNEGDGGAALFARFIQLDGIAVAPDGTIYVSDSLANRVRVIRGNSVTTLAGTGEEGYTGDGGPATEAALHWPSALALGPDGSLYVSDSLNHVVRRISPDGMIESVAGTGTKGFAGDQGPATEARLDYPYGVAVDDDGTLYIADRDNFRIRRVGPEGIIETIAGTGENGFAGNGGLAVAAQFGFLARITLDGDTLLIADQSNSCVRKLRLR